MIIHDGKKYNVDENILKEREILKYLTRKGKDGKNKVNPKHIVRYYDFFKSNSKYYLVMEHGGHMLFDFVVRVHQYIQSGKLSISEWHKCVKIIFNQIVDAVQYIHTKNVCHFDISLENLLINDIECIVDKHGHLRFCKDNIRIKLCDFGLAEKFEADPEEKSDECSSYVSNKYCGKMNYKSPEVTSCMPFDAKKNDVWTVGICLWMMLLGGNMCSRAHVDDKSFAQVISGQMDKLLIKWKRIQYVDAQLIDLLNQIFQYEDKRISLQQIKQHSWTKM